MKGMLRVTVVRGGTGMWRGIAATSAVFILSKTLIAKSRTMLR